MSRVRAVQQGTNAHLIATAQQFYPMSGLTLDLTPGDELGFWKEFQPPSLTLLPHGDDFRNTGMIAGMFDDVVFDPPYVTKGSHDKSTIEAMNKRYGMLHVEKNPMLQWELQIIPGIIEAHYLLKRKGRLWLKCMDYVTSGKIWWFAKMALDELDKAGFKLTDEFILDGNPGPQPLTTKCKTCAGLGVWLDNPEPLPTCTVCDGVGHLPRPQKHAARGHSVLLIATKK